MRRLLVADHRARLTATGGSQPPVQVAQAAVIEGTPPLGERLSRAVPEGSFKIQRCLGAISPSIAI